MLIKDILNLYKKLNKELPIDHHGIRAEVNLDKLL